MVSDATRLASPQKDVCPKTAENFRQLCLAVGSGTALLLARVVKGQTDPRPARRGLFATFLAEG